VRDAEPGFASFSGCLAFLFLLLRLINRRRDLFDPLLIWSQAFANKGTGPVTNAMIKQEKEFEVAMKKLQAAAKAENKDDAQAAWEAARTAFNTYIAIANKNIGKQVRKVDDIPDNLEGYQPAEKRPTTTF